MLCRTQGQNFYYEYSPSNRVSYGLLSDTNLQSGAVEREHCGVAHIDVDLADNLKRCVHRKHRYTDVDRVNVKVCDIRRNSAAAAHIKNGDTILVYPKEDEKVIQTDHYLDRLEEEELMNAMEGDEDGQSRDDGITD